MTAARSPGLLIDMCRFSDSPAGGLHLEGCGGAVTGCHFSRIATTALFARDSTGLDISGNRLEDIGNNGIQVWTSEPAEDGTRVTNNHIVRVAAKAGGTGQNGNGINVYRAGNVIVTGNRISDCAFSAIRNNSGSACLIASNAISRIAEVAIYCEFGFEGAVVSGNMLDDVALGISITNFNEGGRLAAVTGNVIRKVTGGGSLDYTRGVGIAAEADTAITGNVIDGAVDTGISLGWGGYSRNLSATGNVLRDCGIGIGFSVSRRRGSGAGRQQQDLGIAHRQHHGHRSRQAGDAGPGARRRGSDTGHHQWQSCRLNEGTRRHCPSAAGQPVPRPCPHGGVGAGRGRAQGRPPRSLSIRSSSGAVARGAARLLPHAPL